MAIKTVYRPCPCGETAHGITTKVTESGEPIYRCRNCYLERPVKFRSAFTALGRPVAMIESVKRSALVDYRLDRQYGTRFDIQLSLFSKPGEDEKVNIAVVRTEIGTTILLPYWSKNGKLVRKHSKYHTAVIDRVKSYIERGKLE